MPLDHARVIMTLSTEMDLQLDSQESFLHRVIAHILKCGHQRGVREAAKRTQICLQNGNYAETRAARLSTRLSENVCQNGQHEASTKIYQRMSQKNPTFWNQDKSSRFCWVCNVAIMPREMEETSCFPWEELWLQKCKCSFFVSSLAHTSKSRSHCSHRVCVQLLSLQPGSGLESAAALIGSPGAKSPVGHSCPQLCKAQGCFIPAPKAQQTPDSLRLPGDR
ncbi:uncharacterized protein [Agelaius tricolor]|uniref:uncharacterized protein isoform X2 n=1 Tax=Agelaius tricolor TaxID=9191 RepID=UPI0039F211A6